MNLMTATTDDKPEDGWELIKLSIEDDPYAPGVPG